MLPVRGVSALLAALAVVASLSPPDPAHAAVWKRMRPDGTEEYTNVDPGGGPWKRVRDAGTGRRPGRSTSTGALASTSRGGTIWGRENADGTFEFTNQTPVGARWKVLYRTGPGKAAALRGSSDIVPARDHSLGRLSRYDQHLRDQQAIFGVPQALMKAVIKTESDFDPHVVSSAGAVGLMQLMPETARSMGVTDLWDPRQNIMGGARYLQILARRFCRTPGSVETTGGLVCSPEEMVKVIAGYHAGPGAVEKFGGMPPYETTRAYVTSVLGRYDDYRRRDGLTTVGGGAR